MDNGDITTSGQVTFNPLPGNQVEVTVTLQYQPPAGKLGEAVAHLFDNPGKKLVVQISILTMLKTLRFNNVDWEYNKATDCHVPHYVFTKE